MLIVHAPGSVAKTKAGLEILIGEVTIRSRYDVLYDISWWEAGSRNTATVPEAELKYLEGQTMYEVGFHTCNDGRD